MRIKPLLHIVSLLSILLVGTQSYAQDKALDKENWQETTDGVSFDEEPKKPEEPKQAEESKRSSNEDKMDWKAFFNSFNTLIKIFGYTALVGLVIFVLWKLLPYMDNRNKKISSIHQINADPDQLEDHIKSLDFEALVTEAINTDNYTLAIRLYYLQILKQLWDKNFIRWRKQKTNYDYLLETAEQPFNNELKALTRSFERSWYGEKPTYQSTFEKYESQAKKFLKEIDG